MLDWEELPNKQFPMIFHAVYGKDEREENSPSFFNVTEVETVELYLKKLLDDRERSKRLMHLNPNMVGVISPYKKQVGQLYNGCILSMAVFDLRTNRFFIFLFSSKDNEIVVTDKHHTTEQLVEQNQNLLCLKSKFVAYDTSTHSDNFRMLFLKFTEPILEQKCNFPFLLGIGQRVKLFFSKQSQILLFVRCKRFRK